MIGAATIVSGGANTMTMNVDTCHNCLDDDAEGNIFAGCGSLVAGGPKQLTATFLTAPSLCRASIPRRWFRRTCNVHALH